MTNAEIAAGELALDCLAYLRQVVSEHVGEDSAEKVEIAAAGRVGHPGLHRRREAARQGWSS
jgi:hypothetical protein